LRRPVPPLLTVAASAAGVGFAGGVALERRRTARRDARAEEAVAAEDAIPAFEPGRGRAARKPTDIQRAGWKDIAWRTVREVQADDLATVARSIAFSGMLALFPALGAFVSIYGLFADVQTAREHLSSLTGIVPAGAMTLIGDNMVRLAAASEANLSFAFVFGVVLSLWSANSGMKALFKGLNIAYEEEEKRNFVRLNLASLAFTVGTVLLLSLAMAALVALPVALEFLRVDAAVIGLSYLRWPALLLLVSLFLSLLYRYGPSRRKPKWRWTTPGGAVAALLWMGGSALFSWYLTRFADYDATYGSLGAVFGFMMWLWLSTVVVLVGAELNAEIEHQTTVDSTEGVEKPIGSRGARMADHVGEAKRGSLLPAWLSGKLRRR
jgi:membrane protein